jgi:mRNA-degrading endonuclease RelE of RelBE toxin-antitoxin system
MYEVVLSRDAARTLEKVTPAMKRRIIAALERVKANPHSGKRLRGELEGLLSLRIGGMRVYMKWTPRKRRWSFMPLAPGATSTRSEN